MLRTLEAFGLHWDGTVIYQSQRIPLYQAALDTLKSRGQTYPCSCSRRELSGAQDTGYPGTCRAGPTRSGLPTATRFRVDDRSVVLFDDRVQGKCRSELRAQGDFVIQRKDGTAAYQLAVVVDDAAQHVTDVVRGSDLLPSTGWQIALQRALRMPTPRYAHLPIVVAPTREKLAKSRQSLPVDPARAGAVLAGVLRLLGHEPPPELERGGPVCLLAWGASNWCLDAFQGVRSVTPRDTPVVK